MRKPLQPTNSAPRVDIVRFIIIQTNNVLSPWLYLDFQTSTVHEPVFQHWLIPSHYLDGILLEHDIVGGTSWRRDYSMPYTAAASGYDLCILIASCVYLYMYL